MKDIRLTFLWHMHQPLYRLPGERECFAPWVRLHAVRSYYDFARLPDLLPGLRWTVNLVPSLILQVESYLDGGTDSFRELALSPVSSLTPAGRRFLLRNFFSAHPETMIAPLPRYAELHRKRDDAWNRMGEDDGWRDFTDQDFRDLKVLFQLAWFGFAARRDFSAIDELARQGRDYKDEDAAALDRISSEILGRIVPLYRRQWEADRLELSTTPFYHPILPLLIDTDSAREAMPDAMLPSSYGCIGDARQQIHRSLEFMKSRFGRRPRGMWPAEGAVSEAAARLFALEGVEWIATDEEVLHRSARLDDVPPDICRPWRAGPDDSSLLVAFRSHDYSDRIGFRYARDNPETAAQDLLEGVRSIASLSDSPVPVVCVILDGENPWETYPGAGWQFLSALEAAVKDSPGIRLATMSESIGASSGHARRITHLRAGGWVNGRFSIWIGGEQKNAAWEALNFTRRELWELAESTQNAKAMEAILAAEGSDWFWWMDGQFATEHRFNFHDLFQSHLEAAWHALDRPVEPGRLSAFRFAGGAERLVVGPKARVDGQIDGLANSYFEWASAVHFSADQFMIGGTMARSGPVFDAFHIGFGPRQELVFRVDGLTHAPEVLEVVIGGTGGGHTLSLRLVGSDYRLAGEVPPEWDAVVVYRQVLEGKLRCPLVAHDEAGYVVVRLRVQSGGRWTETRPVRIQTPSGVLRLTGWSAV